MRKVTLTMFMSLDGFIAGPGGEFVPPAWSDDMQKYWSDANIDNAGMLLYGRTNFQFNSRFWQQAAADADSPAGLRAFAERMNALPKLVFSRTLENADWNARVVKDDIAGEIGRLKQEPGKDLVLLGGADIAATFMRLDLFDELHLLITPTLLGAGVPLFTGGYERRQLELLSARALDTGSVLLYYRRRADTAGAQ